MYFKNPIARLFYSLWYLFSEKQLTDFPSWYEEEIMDRLFAITMSLMGDPEANRMNFHELRAKLRDLYERYDMGKPAKCPRELMLDDETLDYMGQDFLNMATIVARFEVQGSFFFLINWKINDAYFLHVQSNRKPRPYPKSLIYRWAIERKEKWALKKPLNPVNL